MICPKCSYKTRVVDSRAMTTYVRRRHVCRRATCGHKFSTVEVVFNIRKGRATKQHEILVGSAI